MKLLLKYIGRVYLKVRLKLNTDTKEAINFAEYQFIVTPSSVRSKVFQLKGQSTPKYQQGLLSADPTKTLQTSVFDSSSANESYSVVKLPIDRPPLWRGSVLSPFRSAASRIRSGD